MRARELVIEDLEFLDESGVGATEAAQRADFPSAEAMEKWLERNDAYDLWLSLKGRDAPGVHSNETRRAEAKAKAADGIAALITEAQKSTRKRTRAKADKVSDLVADLRQTLAAEKAEDEVNAEAKAEIERLTRELAKAKARLKGSTSAHVAAVADGPTAAEVRAWAAENNVACTPVGRVPSAVREAYEMAVAS